MNTRNLYKSDAYSVKELLKISSLLCLAKKAPDGPDNTLGAPPLELSSKLQKLKQCRNLATQITEKGAEIFDLLGQEMETKVCSSKELLYTNHLALLGNPSKGDCQAIRVG